MYLKPVDPIGVEVPPLKKSDARFAAINAFKGGFPKTLYKISSSEVRTLLEAAGKSIPAET